MDYPLEYILDQRNLIITSGSPDEYRRYRVHIGHKIAKLRKNLDIQLKIPKNSNEIKDHRIISVDELSSDIRYAELVIYLMERSWAQAMETRSTLELSTNSTKRKHIISRLSKALKFYREMHLQDFIMDSSSSSSLSSSWKLQTVTLMLLIKGAVTFEQHQWHQAVAAYSQARVALQAIISNTSNESSKQVLSDVLNSTVDAALSLSVYQTHSKRSADIPTLAKQITADKAEKRFIELVNSLDPSALDFSHDTVSPSSKLGEIEWRGHKARVNDPDVASLILKAKEQNAKLENKQSIELFDGVLQSWQDASDSVRDAIEKQEKSGDSDQSLYITSTFVSFNLIFRRIQRDMYLVEKTKSEQSAKKNVNRQFESIRDTLRIYDGLCQSCSQLLELPGVFNDDEMSSSLGALKNFFEANKALTVAQAYKLAGDQKKSLAICQFASDTLAGKDKISIEFPGRVITQQHLDELEKKVTMELRKSHAMAYLQHSHESMNSNPLNQPVIDRLKIYPIGSSEDILKNMVSTEPKLLPVPVKPVFYDVAFNYINYGKGEIETMKEQGGAGEKKGFLKGLWS